MTIPDTLAHYDFAASLIHEHGFTGNMQDYRIVVEAGPDSRTPGRYEVICIAAIQVLYESNNWEAGLDEDLTSLQPTSGTLPAAAWRYIADSTAAAEWSERRNMAMHEVVIEFEGASLSIVFQDLVVRGGHQAPAG
jgi:hypothetical protein